MKAKILLISGSQMELKSLEDSLSSEGFSAVCAESAAQGLEIISEDPGIDVVLADQALAESNGGGISEAIRKGHDSIQLILVSDSQTSASDAIRLGVFEILSRPIYREKLALAAGRAAQMAQLARENRRLKSRLMEKSTFSAMIAEGREALEAKEKARMLAPLDTPVLIIGEPGSGRRAIAEAIFNESPRGGSPFIFAHVPPAKDEAELERQIFGYEKEGLKGDSQPVPGLMEKAEDGALYICDVTNLGPRLQAALLGVMQKGEFFRVGGYHPINAGFRLFAGAGLNLEDEVRAGRFREDLYFRLNVAPLSIPPLRRRKEDIPALARYFAKKYYERRGKSAGSITQEAISALTKYRWPGNIRELMETIETMAAQTPSGQIGFSDLPDRVYKDARRPSRISRHEITLQPYADEKMEFERKYLLRALEECEGNITVMARITDLSRPALYEKLRKHGLK